MPSKNMASAFALTPKQMIKAIERNLKRGLVSSITGSPGIGKSDIVRKVAKKLNLKVIDIRLSQASPEDLNGFPAVIDGVAQFIPFDHFPTMLKEIPEGYSGWLIFFDEITSAPKAVQAASYKVILDRFIGGIPLHDACGIVAAGNLLSDKAVVVQQSTALQSRLVQLELMVSAPEWIEWAHQNQKDPRVVAYISHDPDALHVFDPNHNDKTFACPRTWDFVCRYIDDKPELDFIDNANIVGMISQGMGVEFFEFCNVWKELKTIDDIMADPEHVAIPSNHGHKFAALGYLYSHVTNDNFEKLMKYITRFPEELQSVFMKGLAHRDASFRKHPVYVKNTVKLLRFIGEDEEDVFSIA